MDLSNQPFATFDLVVAVLEGLVNGSLTREAAGAWYQQILEEQTLGDKGYTVTSPAYRKTGRPENLERTAFGFLADFWVLTKSWDNGPNNEPFWLTTKEIKDRREQLSSSPPQRQHGQIHEIPLTQLRDVYQEQSLLAVFSTPSALSWPKGLWWWRYTGDSPHWFQTCVFHFKSEVFKVEKVLDGPHDRDLALWRCRPDTVGGELMVEICCELGFKWKNLVHFQRSSFYQEPYSLFRYDDNGGEFLMERFSNFVEAEMTRQMYEDRGHKQIYYLKKAD